MINQKELETVIANGKTMLRSITEGMTRDDLGDPYNISKHLRYAGQYLEQLSAYWNAWPEKEVYHVLTRSFWQLGAAQGKLEIYKELQDEKVSGATRQTDD